MEDNKTAHICPITRETTTPATEFAFCRGGNTAHVCFFDASQLIDYILQSGDYLEPESRLPFPEKDLVRLDELGATLGKPR
jgi:hypothetical protein